MLFPENVHLNGNLFEFEGNGAAVVMQALVNQDAVQDAAVALVHGANGAQIMTMTGKILQNAAEKRGEVLHPAQLGYPVGSVPYVHLLKCWNFAELHDASVRIDYSEVPQRWTLGQLLCAARPYIDNPWGSFRGDNNQGGESLPHTFGFFHINGPRVISVQVLKKGQPEVSGFKIVRDNPTVKLGELPISFILRNIHIRESRGERDSSYRCHYEDEHGVIISSQSCSRDEVVRKLGLILEAKGLVQSNGYSNPAVYCINNTYKEGSQGFTSIYGQIIITRYGGPDGKAVDVKETSEENKNHAAGRVLVEAMVKTSALIFGMFLRPTGFKQIQDESPDPKKFDDGWIPPGGWRYIAGSDNLFMGPTTDDRGVLAPHYLTFERTNIKEKHRAFNRAKGGQGGVNTGINTRGDLYEAHVWQQGVSQPPKQTGGENTAKGRK